MAEELKKEFPVKKVELHVKKVELQAVQSKGLEAGEGEVFVLCGNLWGKPPGLTKGQRANAANTIQAGVKIRAGVYGEISHFEIVR